MDALVVAEPMTDRERVAFDLYSCAHAVREYADARFVLLFAALEAMLEDAPRPPESVRHVDRLIDLTEKAGLPESETNSLVGSLRWLRSHSIRSTGRRFVADRLKGRRYGDRSAEQVFLASYDLRNRLLHGQQPFPSRHDVSSETGGLEQMISQILAGPVHDASQEGPDGRAV